MDINFCVHLGKSVPETSKLLGSESIVVDKYSGRPDITRTAEKIEKVSVAVRKNRFQTIAESIGIFSVSSQWILTKDLNMDRVCQHIVLRMLNEDQSTYEVKSASRDELKDMAKN
ncbi:hypothetical protein TNCV_4216241 [Trichonephila clavipes]|nr:hypothetical protein TNCV_4216241 [Trichonephila clavipes]